MSKAMPQLHTVYFVYYGLLPHEEQRPPTTLHQNTVFSSSIQTTLHQSTPTVVVFSCSIQTTLHKSTVFSSSIQMTLHQSTPSVGCLLQLLQDDAPPEHPDCSCLLQLLQDDAPPEHPDCGLSSPAPSRLRSTRAPRLRAVFSSSIQTTLHKSTPTAGCLLQLHPGDAPPEHADCGLSSPAASRRRSTRALSSPAPSRRRSTRARRLWAVFSSCFKTTLHKSTVFSSSIQTTLHQSTPTVGCLLQLHPDDAPPEHDDCGLSSPASSRRRSTRARRLWAVFSSCFKTTLHQSTPTVGCLLQLLPAVTAVMYFCLGVSASCVPGSPRSSLSVPGSPRSSLSVPGSPKSSLSVPGSPRSSLSVPGSLILSCRSKFSRLIFLLSSSLA